jgi:hypothetical protein
MRVLWLLLGLATIVITLLAYVTYIFQRRMKCRPTIDIENYCRLAQTGDVVLISYMGYGNGLKDRLINRLILLLSGDREWSHVAVVVKKGDTPYVFEVCHRDVCVNHVYDVSNSPTKDSGMIELSRYLEVNCHRKHQHVAVRRIRSEHKLQTGDAHAWSLIDQLNRILIYPSSFLMMLFGQMFRSPLDEQSKYLTCSESVGWVLSRMGYQLREFHRGMGLYPMVRDDSSLFGDIVYLVPSSRASESFQQFQQGLETACQQCLVL